MSDTPPLLEQPPYRNTVPCDWCAWDSRKSEYAPANDAVGVLGKPVGNFKYCCYGHFDIAMIAGFQPRLLPLEPTFENMLLRKGKE